MKVQQPAARLPAAATCGPGIAAARVGERRLLELVEQVRRRDVRRRRSTASWTTASRSRGGRSRSCRRARSRSPRSRTAARSTASTVEITDDEFVVDLRDNPDQDRGPNNASRDGSLVAAQMVFMNITDVAQRRPTPGHFRPLQAAHAPGLGLRPERRRPRSRIYYEVEIRLYDLIWRCLAPHLGGRLPAGSFASICGTFIGGPHPDTGRHFTIVEPQVGGWGASRATRRQQRDVQRLPRRHVQLPGRGRRGALRAVRRPARAERRAGRRGRAPRRQGDRRSTTGCARTAASSPAPTRATCTSRGRWRAAARARRTTPR